MESMSEPDPKHAVKTEYFHFNQIEKYFLGAERGDVFQTISDRTFADLDMEDIFRFMDRTVSRVGQQCLYYFVRTIPGNTVRKTKLENTIGLFQTNAVLRENLTKEISSLNKRDAYYITSLFQGKYIERPGWFWVIRFLFALSIVAAISSFFFQQALIILFIIFPVNMAIHYWNKNNVYQYASSIPQLVVLNQVAKKILSNKAFADQDLKKSVDILENLSIQMSLFKIEARLQSEIGQFIEYLLELIKALFLIEPVVLFTTLKALESKKQHIENIFLLVGETDVALSILALRENVPYYCHAGTPETNKSMSMKGLYHPLLIQGVPNDLTLNGKSGLLTGSNMSGKTTFIRTVGINAILGQTINTCCAKEFLAPQIKIHSSIRIADNLLDEKSYYFEEVLTLKALLEECKSGDSNLFLLDELFKGTNTIERIAIGKAVLEYLTQKDNLVLVSTHDRELANCLEDTFDLYHFTEIIAENEIVFDYKIKRGKLNTTNAIRILGLNNYPQEVVDEALRISSEMKHDL